MWCFSNSADPIIFRPLSPCSEVFLALPRFRVSPLPALAAFRFISTAHVEKLAHCSDVIAAVNEQTSTEKERPIAGPSFSYRLSHPGGIAWRARKFNRTKRKWMQGRPLLLTPSWQPATWERRRSVLRKQPQQQEWRASARTIARSTSSDGAWLGALSVLFSVPGL